MVVADRIAALLCELGEEPLTDREARLLGAQLRAGQELATCVLRGPLEEERLAQLADFMARSLTRERLCWLRHMRPEDLSRRDLERLVKDHRTREHEIRNAVEGWSPGLSAPQSLLYVEKVGRHVSDDLTYDLGPKLKRWARGF